MTSQTRLIPRKKWALVATGIMLVLAGIGFMYPLYKSTAAEKERQEEVFNPQNQEKAAKQAPSSSSKNNIANLVFKEITIPYLRSQDWEGSELGEMQKVADYSTYTSYITSYQSEGLTINGLLTKPKGEMPNEGWPGIIFVHGYIPPNEYRTLENYESYVDFLADQGFVVFKIDLRGHADSEGPPSSGYFSADYVVDILNAYESLKRTNFVNQVGLWGHSFSGNLVFRAMVAKKDIPAAVIWAGAVYTYEDFFDYSINDNSYQPPETDSERAEKRRELFDTHGNFDPESDFWQQVVPTNYLNSVEGSLQVHHAVNDSVVDVRYSRNLMNVLEGTNIEAELFEYESGGHNIEGSSFTTAMQRTADFFQRNLAN